MRYSLDQAVRVRLRRETGRRPSPRLRGRVREGARQRETRQFTLSPPLSRKREREQTACAARIRRSHGRSHGRSWVRSARSRVTVNGKRYEEEVEVRWTLADFLRHQINLTGTHLGCEHGVCGACTILLDGRSARSCLMLAVQANGHEILTVEGHRAVARQAASAAAGVPRASRPAVRLLHARHADHAARIPARQSGPDRAGGADRDLRQPVPLHRLPEHRHRDARCREAAAGDANATQVRHSNAVSRPRGEGLG